MKLDLLDRLLISTLSAICFIMSSSVNILNEDKGNVTCTIWNLGIKRVIFFVIYLYVHYMKCIKLWVEVLKLYLYVYSKICNYQERFHKLFKTLRELHVHEIFAWFDLAKIKSNFVSSQTFTLLLMEVILNILTFSFWTQSTVNGSEYFEWLRVQCCILDSCKTISSAAHQLLMTPVNVLYHLSLQLHPVRV